ncbi:cell division protein FtsA [Oceanirhabdus seepicola]|uniref:Cell division protein FtsA n=1 Tax=Oceanirhabdus seepicola TaxID=2828781 RepID=A0A9J6P481_9CLOT|nr:cell division protein FtsA [Oceanirhabdus seepicola]MCM1990881.1 cell division protein FtsA [Oceanirhabdus seepicola]
MNEYVIGIDIGSSKIYAAVGKIDSEENLQIMGISSSKCEGLNKGIVIDIESTAKSIEKCKGQLQKMVEQDFNSAYLVVPGGICDLIESKGVVAVSALENTVTHKDKDRAIEASKFISITSDKEIIGVIPQDYVIDECDKIKDPVGMCGNKLEANVKVVTARSSVINNLIKSVEAAGLTVKGLELKPIAAASVVLSQEEKKFGAALVDVGAETIDLSVFSNGKLCYTSIIPFGGKAITNDLSVGLKVSMDEAENMKLKYGTLKKDVSNETFTCNNISGEFIEVKHGFLVDIIEARVSELLEFIKAELEKSGYEKSIERVILVGGGITLFKGIKDVGEEILNKPVRIGLPDYIGAASPLFSNVVGVLKNAIDENNKSSNRKNVVSDFIDDDLYDDEDDEIYAERKGLAKRIKNIFSNLFS